MMAKPSPSPLTPRAMKSKAMSVRAERIVLMLFTAPRLIGVVKRTITTIFIAGKTDVTQLILIKIGECPQRNPMISPFLERRVHDNQRIDGVQDDVAIS